MILTFLSSLIFHMVKTLKKNELCTSFLFLRFQIVEMFRKELVIGIGFLFVFDNDLSQLNKYMLFKIENGIIH